MGKGIGMGRLMMGWNNSAVWIRRGVLAGLLWFGAQAADAQFPGMQPAERPKPPPAAVTNATAATNGLGAATNLAPARVRAAGEALPGAAVGVPADAGRDAEAGQLHAWPLATWQRFMGEQSPYRPLILTILTLVVLINLKAYLTRVVRRQVNENAFRQENAAGFLKVWNVVWKFLITILVLMAMSGSLRLLGLTAGFFGMMLGWSLQQPVTGLAAWLMIILKKPFKIGDRVIIGGITGDVTGISLTHVILNQVGGSIGGEERSGRGILIPNAILFQNIIINYTLDQEYMLDEVPVRLTFDSDWDEAKRLLIAAATDVTAPIIAKTGQQPFIRAEFLDWGILVRLRYQTIPADRQEISTNIIERLLKDFGAAFPRVRFAIPASTVRYRPEHGATAFGAAPAAESKG
jgi:small-conductance mechanosensitive channel